MLRGPRSMEFDGSLHEERKHLAVDPQPLVVRQAGAEAADSLEIWDNSCKTRCIPRDWLRDAPEDQLRLLGWRTGLSVRHISFSNGLLLQMPRATASDRRDGAGATLRFRR